MCPLLVAVTGHLVYPDLIFSLLWPMPLSWDAMIGKYLAWGWGEGRGTAPLILGIKTKNHRRKNLDDWVSKTKTAPNPLDQVKGWVSKKTAVLHRWEYYNIIWFYQLG